MSINPYDQTGWIVIDQNFYEYSIPSGGSSDNGTGAEETYPPNLTAYIHSKLPLNWDWRPLGFTEDVHLNWDSQNGEYRDINPNFYTWFDSSGYRVAIKKIGGSYYQGLVDKNGNLVPGSEFDTSADDGMFFAIGMIALSIATGGVAAAGLGDPSIGAAVLGQSTALANPVLTQAITQTSLQTMANGGNVAEAVRNTVTNVAGNYIGGIVGGGVSNITGVDVIGKTTADVSSAYVTGQDLRSAAISSLAAQGINASITHADNPPLVIPSNVAIIDNVNQSSNSVGVNMDYGLFNSDIFSSPISSVADMPAISFTDTANYVNDPTSFNILPVDNVSIDSAAIAPISYGFDTQVISNTGPNPIDSSQIPSLFPSSNTVPSTATGPASANTDFSATPIVNTLTSAAINALKVIAAYGAIKGSVNQAARTVSSSGVSVIGSDGLIRTQNPNGTVTVTRPPVRSPQTAIDGTLIVNNGDGTYTSVNPIGNTSTIAYPSNAGNSGGLTNLLNSSNPNLPLYAGLGFLAFILLKK
jgi:hypothetical protein